MGKKKLEIFKSEDVPTDPVLQSLFYLSKYGRGFKYDLEFEKGEKEQVFPEDRLMDTNHIFAVSRKSIVKLNDAVHISISLKYLMEILHFLDLLNVELLMIHSKKDSPLTIEAKWQDEKIYLSLAPRNEKNIDDKDDEDEDQ